MQHLTCFLHPFESPPVPTTLPNRYLNFSTDQHCFLTLKLKYCFPFIFIYWRKSSLKFKGKLFLLYYVLSSRSYFLSIIIFVYIPLLLTFLSFVRPVIIPLPLHSFVYTFRTFISFRHFSSIPFSFVLLVQPIVINFSFPCPLSALHSSPS